MKIMGTHQITPELIYNEYIKIRSKRFHVLSEWRCDNGLGGCTPEVIKEKIKRKTKQELLKLYYDLKKR